MTKTELKRFRVLLDHKIAELGGGISGHREALAIETSSDELDRTQNANERDNAMNTLERTSNRLREVQAALRQMDRGVFGICVGCDAEINSKRLTAVPWASYCIECQLAADREEEPTLLAAI
jgi:DnaK suppressor protein